MRIAKWANAFRNFRKEDHVFVQYMKSGGSRPTIKRAGVFTEVTELGFPYYRII